MRLENQGTRKTEDSYPSNTFNEYCLYVLTTNSSKYAALRSILKSVLNISDDELGNRVNDRKRVVSEDQDRTIREKLQEVKEEKDDSMRQYCHLYRYEITKKIAERFERGLRSLSVTDAEVVLFTMYNIVIDKMVSRMKSHKSLSASISNLIAVAVTNEENIFHRVRENRRKKLVTNGITRDFNIPYSYHDFQYYFAHIKEGSVKENHPDFSKLKAYRLKKLGDLVLSWRKEHEFTIEEADEFIEQAIMQFISNLHHKHQSIRMKVNTAFHKYKIRSSAIQIAVAEKRIFRAPEEELTLGEIARKFSVTKSRVGKIEADTWSDFINFVKKELQREF